MRLENKTNKAWNLLVAGDVESAYKALAGARLISREKEVIRQANFLKTYDYPELEIIEDKVKHEFALVICWKFLLKYGSSTFIIDDFAPLLGNAFKFSADLNAIGDTLGHSRPISIPFTPEQWPELLILPSLSLVARSIFVRTIKYAQIRLGGLADTQVIGGLDLPQNKQAFFELAQAGLIKTGMTIDELLPDLMMAKTLKEVKQFAFDHNSDFHGTKYQIIQSVISDVDYRMIKKWLNLEADKEFIYPHLSNLSSLKDYIWNQSSILEGYINWVYQTKCLNKSEQEIINERTTSLTEKAIRDRYKPMEPWRPSLKNKKTREVRIWKSKKMLLLMSIWDSNCDTILEGIVQKYAWDWDTKIEESIEAHFSGDILLAYKEACNQNFLLQKLCERRLKELGVKVRQPSPIQCAGCGINFMDWSVDSDLAERVNYKIFFCKGCYARAFYTPLNSKSTEFNQELMLAQLSTLARIEGGLECVIHKQLHHAKTIAEENQIAYVKLLMDMPSRDIYEKTFGSWFQILIGIGILEEGARRSSRGIKSIAKDGHECNSLAERIIDDWLYSHHIQHEKEPLYPYHFRLNPSKLRADWKVQDILIEYAGLMDEPDYAAKMKAKQEIAEEFGLSLLILEPEDILNLDLKLVGLTSP